MSEQQNDFGAGGLLPPGCGAARSTPAPIPGTFPRRPAAPGVHGPWSDALDARLRADWDAGLSASEIGRRLNVTKNSVIGRAGRIGLPSRPSPLHPPTDREPRPYKMRGVPKKKPGPIQLYPQGSAVHGLARLFPAPDPRDPLPAVRSITGHAALPIPRGVVGRSPTCQWTDCNRAPWLFCDAPSVAGYSWCAAHKSAVFRAEAA